MASFAVASRGSSTRRVFIPGYTSEHANSFGSNPTLTSWSNFTSCIIVERGNSNKCGKTFVCDSNKFWQILQLNIPATWKNEAKSFFARQLFLLFDDEYLKVPLQGKKQMAKGGREKHE
jgi:hypothetical protein